MDTARISIERGSAWMDRARAYRILVDGAERDRVKNGATAVVDVAPGPHVVQLRIDWAYSPEITVQVPPGGEVRLRCRSKANVVTAIYYSTLGRKRYLQLEPV